MAERNYSMPTRALGTPGKVVARLVFRGYTWEEREAILHVAIANNRLEDLITCPPHRLEQYLAMAVEAKLLEPLPFGVLDAPQAP